jgi:hypothetical protein
LIIHADLGKTPLLPVSRRNVMASFAKLRKVNGWIRKLSQSCDSFCSSSKGKFWNFINCSRHLYCRFHENCCNCIVIETIANVLFVKMKLACAFWYFHFHSIAKQTLRSFRELGQVCWKPNEVVVWLYLLVSVLTFASSAVKLQDGDSCDVLRYLQHWCFIRYALFRIAGWLYCKSSSAV